MVGLLIGGPVAAVEASACRPFREGESAWEYILHSLWIAGHQTQFLFVKQCANFLHQCGIIPCLKYVLYLYIYIYISIYPYINVKYQHSYKYSCCPEISPVNNRHSTSQEPLVNRVSNEKFGKMPKPFCRCSTHFASTTWTFQGLQMNAKQELSERFVLLSSIDS